MRQVQLRDKIDIFLERPAAYMIPHKNQKAAAEKRKDKFKPKVMVGDLRKPTCEFTSDLVLMAHNTRLIKRKMDEEGAKASESLQQLRLKERAKRKIATIIND